MDAAARKRLEGFPDSLRGVKFAFDRDDSRHAKLERMADRLDADLTAALSSLDAAEKRVGVLEGALAKLMRAEMEYEESTGCALDDPITDACVEAHELLTRLGAI